MAKSETRTFAGVSNWYGGLVVLVVLFILAWAFLVATQPLVGLLLTTAFISTYAAARLDGIEHADVVACYGLWRGAW